jgi:hypothetical protein
MLDAYREKAERPALSQDERCYFTKSGDVEKGPFQLDALVRGVQSNVLKMSALVRAEDEADWRRLRALPELSRKLAPPARRRDVRPLYERDLTPEERGNFLGGFAAGLFAGVIGWVIVEGVARGGRTKAGARLGFVTASVLVFGSLMRGV